MFTIEELDAPALARYRDNLVALLTNVVNGGASVNFIAPLAPDIAYAYWDRVAAEVQGNSRVVLAAIQREVIGCVHLALATQPNGRHRAEVQKLLVHTQQRKQGIGSALMKAAEVKAHNLGRSLLVLDTEAGSAAESLYQRCGFIRSGTIPRFALNSDGSALIDTVIYYKLIE